MLLPYYICNKIIPFGISYKFVWDAYTLQMEYQLKPYRRQSGQVLTSTNEHKYVKRKVTETTVYLRCALFRDGCKATAKLNKKEI